MNWEAIKLIYIQVLKHGAKIRWDGNDCYTLTNYDPNGNLQWEIKYHQDIPLCGWNNK